MPSIDALGEIEVVISVRLGQTRMPLAQAAALVEGSVVSLECAPDAPVDVLVNGIAIATGDLVIGDDGGLGVELHAVRP